MILGLDFDGVMHPVNSATEPKFCRLELLEAWLREHASVDIVITSSWREVHPLNEMRSYFAEDLQSRVLGITPFAHRLFGPAWQRTSEAAAAARHERQAELEAWLREANRHDPWMALDDDPQLFEPRLARLVLCDSNTGLTVERLAQLHALAADLELAWRHVTTDADSLGGPPVFTGTRVPIEIVVAALDEGIGMDRVRRSHAFVTDELVKPLALTCACGRSLAGRRGPPERATQGGKGVNVSKLWEMRIAHTHRPVETRACAGCGGRD